MVEHGFGPSRRYWLIHNGREYDLKAIVGVAQKYVSDAWTRSAGAADSDFSGGIWTAAAALGALGYVVRGPAWLQPAARCLIAAGSTAVSKALGLSWAPGEAAAPPVLKRRGHATRKAVVRRSFEITDDQKREVPAHLEELLQPTPSGMAKLLAAWDGLSCETQILALVENRPTLGAGWFSAGTISGTVKAGTRQLNEVDAIRQTVLPWAAAQARMGSRERTNASLSPNTVSTSCPRPS